MSDDRMSGPAAIWDAALAEGRILLQREADGGALFPPRILAADHGWIEASGRGTIYSLSWIPARAPAEPRNVALIDLAEGPRIMAPVVGIDAPAIGLAVQARIEPDGEGHRIVFGAAG